VGTKIWQYNNTCCGGRNCTGVSRFFVLTHLLPSGMDYPMSPEATFHYSLWTFWTFNLSSLAADYPTIKKIGVPGNFGSFSTECCHSGPQFLMGLARYYFSTPRYK